MSRKSISFFHLKYQFFKPLDFATQHSHNTLPPANHLLTVVRYGTGLPCFIQASEWDQKWEVTIVFSGTLWQKHGKKHKLCIPKQ